MKQARQARGPEREKKLRSLVQYEIVDRVISCGVRRCESRREKSAAKGSSRASGKGSDQAAPERPAPAEGSVVVARRDRKPFTISNVRWGTDFVEQRWMQEDSLSALIRRLADDPPEEHVIIAVAGKSAFSPSRLAFSGAGDSPSATRTAPTTWTPPGSGGCGDASTTSVGEEGDPSVQGTVPDRALTAETPPIDRKLVRMAGQWQRDVNELHALLLPATDIEIRALTDRREA